MFLTDDGPKDLTWYEEFAKAFAESGNAAIVTTRERGQKPDIMDIMLTILSRETPF